MLTGEYNECPVCGVETKVIAKKINDELHYHSCLNCGVLFLNNYDLTNICETENDNPESRNTEKLNKVRIARMNSYLNPFNEIQTNVFIDFGCGKGYLSDLINLTNSICHKIDKDTPLQLKDIDNETIDGIFMVEVIEHINNPLEVLKELKRVIKRGGCIYIETSFVDHINNNSTYIDPKIGHRVIYSILSFMKICTKLGFIMSIINNNCLILHKV